MNGDLPDLWTGRHVVYRVFNADDDLLYVGMSRQLSARCVAHATSSYWYPQATRIAVRLYPSAAAAQRAEREAIRLECPRFNIAHKDYRNRHRWTAAQFRDYIDAVRQVDTDSVRRRVAKLEREYRNLFGPSLVASA